MNQAAELKTNVFLNATLEEIDQFRNGAADVQINACLAMHWLLQWKRYVTTKSDNENNA